MLSPAWEVQIQRARLIEQAGVEALIALDPGYPADGPAMIPPGVPFGHLSRELGSAYAALAGATGLGATGAGQQRLGRRRRRDRRRDDALRLRPPPHRRESALRPLRAHRVPGVLPRRRDGARLPRRHLGLQPPHRLGRDGGAGEHAGRRRGGVRRRRPLSHAGRLGAAPARSRSASRCGATPTRFCASARRATAPSCRRGYRACGTRWRCDRRCSTRRRRCRRCSISRARATSTASVPRSRRSRSSTWSSATPTWRATSGCR